MGAVCTVKRSPVTQQTAALTQLYAQLKLLFPEKCAPTKTNSLSLADRSVCMLATADAYTGHMPRFANLTASCQTLSQLGSVLQHV